MIALETRSCRLEPVTPDHIDALHRLWTDADVRRYLWDDKVIGRDVVEEVVAASVESFHKYGFGQWAAYEKNTEPLIGFCGLRHIDGRDIELLYGLYGSHWGRGLAVEFSRAVLQYAFRTLSLSRIIADTDPPNTASVRVMEKLGMSFEGEVERAGMKAIRYSITKEQFLSSV